MQNSSMSLANFMKIAFQDLKTVAALCPTSAYAAQRIVQKIKGEHKFIIEYGAGNGVITKKILKKIPADGRVIAVELNEKFISELQKIKDERLIILNDDVAGISKNLTKLGPPRIDAVISGIPFSLMNMETGKGIIENTYDALINSGLFVAYQHSPYLLPHLEDIFKDVRCYFEPRNFLPYFIMVAEK